MNISDRYRYKNIFNNTELYHEPTIYAGKSVSSPGIGPDLVVLGNTTLGLAFTPDVTTDRAYQLFKLPQNYVAGETSIHCHWSKNVDTNQSGKWVRWHIGYTVFNGATDNVGSGSNTINAYVEDQYEDTGTTNRIIHVTPYVYIDSFQPGSYVSIFIDCETPTSGSALSGEPVLVSMNLVYRHYINKGDRAY